MNKFLIVRNDGKDTNGAVTKKIADFLDKEGKEYVICPKDENKAIMKDRIPKDIDLALVIGGDGSLIETARALQDIQAPILGINMGTLGFLTEVEVKDIEDALSKVLAGEYDLENRMMLEGTFADGKKLVALNDIVLSRKGVLRVIHFDLFVNGELLNSYEADGIIISTPTGSTAYNLSAGGPIVEPTASMIVITPICSHALNTSSVVLSSEDEIEISIGEGRNHTVEEAFIAFDGNEMVSLETGDKVVVHKAEAETKLLKLSKVSFLEILRKKMKGN